MLIPTGSLLPPASFSSSSSSSLFSSLGSLHFPSLFFVSIPFHNSKTIYSLGSRFPYLPFLSRFPSPLHAIIFPSLTSLFSAPRTGPLLFRFPFFCVLFPLYFPFLSFISSSLTPYFLHMFSLSLFPYISSSFFLLLNSLHFSSPFFLTQIPFFPSFCYSSPSFHSLTLFLFLVPPFLRNLFPSLSSLTFPCTRRSLPVSLPQSYVDVNVITHLS